MIPINFGTDLDRANIIAIDVSHALAHRCQVFKSFKVHHDVRPDSMLILHASREVVEEDGFDELLDNVRDRIDEIESLHRTRELTVCTCKNPLPSDSNFIHSSRMWMLATRSDSPWTRAAAEWSRIPEFVL
jgi:hypothetical protein